MSPEECIADLDAGLAETGEDVILRRTVGTAPNVLNIDVECRATIRTWRLKEEELVGGIAQAVILATISPTQIAAAQWPGGVAPGAAVDPSIPRRLDRLIVGGRVHMIEAVDPITVNGVNVRYNMQLLG